MPHQGSPVHRSARALIGLLILISSLPLGCRPGGQPQPAALSIKIDSPASGLEVEVGEQVSIQSTATSPSTVSWIELWVDGELADSAQAPTPLQPQFSAVQLWRAAASGEYLIEVRAYDEKGTVSPPASIVIRVSGEEAAQMPTAEPEESSIIPTATALPTVAWPTSAPTVPVCENDAEFVEDVTVPDNTEFAPGTEFSKTWRLANSGTCPWRTGYVLAFLEGEQMGGPDGSSIPETEPRGEADISVTLVAPEEPGTYRGDWRLRAPDGELFGAKLYVQIIVVVPTATPELTATVALTVTPELTATATLTATPAVTVTATATMTP